MVPGKALPVSGDFLGAAECVASSSEENQPDKDQDQDHEHQASVFTEGFKHAAGLLDGELLGPGGGVVKQGLAGDQGGSLVEGAGDFRWSGAKPAGAGTDPVRLVRK